MTRDFTVVAIVSAYNEADIIAPVIAHLIAQGVSVYLLDHGSTDGTSRAAAPFLGRGLLAIEPFPDERFPSARDRFAWADILTRKRELSAELDADWFIHQDADEFRESPWTDLTLAEAIRRVDRLGYNAIDFELFNFWPTDNALEAGADPRATMRFYERTALWNKAQVKCWKKQASPPDLLSSGGHDALFPGRMVFPVRFILRHYPIRNESHGVRKVFAERRARVLPQEAARGWHVQYANVTEGQPLLRDPSTLLEYDPNAARLAVVLRHRGVEALEAALDVAATEVDGLTSQIGTLETRIRALESDLAEGRSELAAHHAENQRLLDQLAKAVDDARGQRRLIEDLYSSKSWRWTSPLRAIHARLQRR